MIPRVFDPKLFSKEIKPKPVDLDSSLSESQREALAANQREIDAENERRRLDREDRERTYERDRRDEQTARDSLKLGNALRVEQRESEAGKFEARQRQTLEHTQHQSLIGDLRDKPSLLERIKPPLGKIYKSKLGK